LIDFEHSLGEGYDEEAEIDATDDPCVDAILQRIHLSKSTWQPGQRGKQPKQSRRSAHKPPPVPEWQTRLTQLRRARPSAPQAYERPARSRELALILVPGECESQLVLNAFHREPRKTGELGVLKELKIGPHAESHFEDPEDRLTLALLAGATPFFQVYGYGYSYGGGGPETSKVCLSPPLWETVLPRLSARGQLRWTAIRTNFNPAEADPLVYDARPVPFRVVTTAGEKGWVVAGRLLGDEPRDVAAGDRLLAEGQLLLTGGRLAPVALDRPGDGPWLAHFAQHGAFHVKRGEEQAFLEWLREFPSLPSLDLPAEWAWQERQGNPTPCIVI
jgi:hypothetical protein